MNDAFGRSIMCMHNGRLLGGNSAFAHLGTYQERGEEIIGEVITQRHNDDPYYKPLMDTDVAAISVRGSCKATGSVLKAAPRRGPALVLGRPDTARRRGAAAGRRGRAGRHHQRALFHSAARARRHQSGPVRRHAADGRPHPRRRCLFLLPRLLLLGRRPLEGRDPQSGAHAGEGRKSRVRRLRGRHRLYRHLRRSGAELEAIALAGKRSLRLAATLKLMRPA